MIKITTPHVNVKQGGFLRELALDAKAMHAEGSVSASTVSYDIEAQFIELDQAKSIASIPDTTVENMELFIEVDSPDDLVPDDLFGSTSEDEEGEVTKLTWVEWCRPNKQPVEINGLFFVRTSSNTNNWPELSTLSPVYSNLILTKDLPTPTEPPS